MPNTAKLCFSNTKTQRRSISLFNNACQKNVYYATHVFAFVYAKIRYLAYEELNTKENKESF